MEEMRQIGHVELICDLLHLLRFVHVTTFISTKDVTGQPLHLKIEMKPVFANFSCSITPTKGVVSKKLPILD